MAGQSADDEIIERAKHIGFESAWTILKGQGYNNQFEGGWKMVNDTVQVVGRVVYCAVYAEPPRCGSENKRARKNEGRKGNTNSWPIDVLQKVMFA